jgi:cytidine deaminase
MSTETENSVQFTDKMLLELARDTRARAWAPYSNFTVGAACLGGSGTSYFGCNVENASHPVGVCAERSALASAIAHGETRVTIIAIAGGPRESPPLDDIRPCGMCLQFMSEFMSQDSRVLIADGTDRSVEFRLGELLPQGFKLK